jgi:hypothetical protein
MTCVQSIQVYSDPEVSLWNDSSWLDENHKGKDGLSGMFLVSLVISYMKIEIYTYRYRM